MCYRTVAVGSLKGGASVPLAALASSRREGTVCLRVPPFRRFVSPATVRFVSLDRRAQGM